MRRQHATARIKAGRQKLLPQPARREAVTVLWHALEIEGIHAEGCDGELNPVCSMGSDEDGSYLVMSIEVPVPFTTAYDAWTRFDAIPNFMRGHSLAESDCSQMTWCVRTADDQFAWQAEISEEVPFEAIAWKSVKGTPHPGFGTVRFEPIRHQVTLILVKIGFDLHSGGLWSGDPMPSVRHLLGQNMKRFQAALTIPWRYPFPGPLPRLSDRLI